MRKTLGLVNFSVDKRVTITMLILIVMVFGVLSLTRLGLDMLPDITFPMCSVVVQYSGVAPEEMEQLITAPIEGMVASVNGVKRITSTSAEGISTINVEFEWGTNLDYAAQGIKDNIDFVRDYLPKDMTEPQVFKFNLSQIPILFLGVTGIDDTYKLRKFLSDNVVERLQRLDGVALAAVYGGKQREVRVSLEPAKVKYRGLSIDQIIGALGAQNLNTPAGYMVQGQTDYLFRAIGEFRDLDDIRNAIVGAAGDGAPVRLRDVGEVTDTYRETRSMARMDGKESVFLVVNKRSGANTLQVSNRLNKELAAVKKAYPHLSFLTIFDQGLPVKKVTSATARNALEGGILAVGFMFLFLLSVRPTLIIAVAIPLSLISTFIILYVGGFTLNLMTLGGLALGIGMLVDNAVVVIENTYRHLEQGKSRVEAAKVGASEVGMAISACTFTHIVVFLPMLFSQGLAGILTRGLCLTIMFSLLASLFVALTIVPMLASVFFKDRHAQARGTWFTPVREWYGAKLSWSLDNPGKVVLTVVVALGATIGVSVPFLGTEFMPKSDSDMLMLTVEMPVGTPLSEAQKFSAQIQGLFAKNPEVVSVGEIIGRDENDKGGPDQGPASGPHVVQAFVRLKDADDRSRTSMELEDEIRGQLPVLRDTRYRFTSMTGFGAGGKPVRINVYGKDLATLKEMCGNIAALVKDVAGLKDIESSFSRGRPEFHFVVDRQKALQYGLVPAQIQAALKTANLGTIATRYRTGEDEIDVRVIFGTQFRGDVDAIKQIPLRTPSGAVIPLSQVADVAPAQGPTQINRSDKYRVGVVDANTSDRALGTIVKDVQARIKKLNKSLPDGYWIQLKGDYEDMKETFGQLMLALLLSVILVYMVMASQFESLVHPFIIMFTMPLAIMGVLLILLLFGKSFSMVAFVGVIILSGIVVSNGIVMIDYVNQLREGGMSVRDALIQGGKTRLRPILITAGTTIFGMVPMAVSQGDGAQMRSPLAFTIIGGLTTSTILTLFVVPIIYQYMDRWAQAVKNRVKRAIH